MNKSVMFIIIVFILFYLGPPLWERVDAIILRAELKEALYHFVEEACDEEIEIIHLESPPYTTNYIMVIYESWSAKTSKDQFFTGNISPKAKFVTMSHNVCNYNTKYTLNRKSNRFELHDYDVMPDVKLYRYTSLYFAVVLAIGLVGAFIIWGFEARI